MNTRFTKKIRVLLFLLLSAILSPVFNTAQNNTGIWEWVKQLNGGTNNSTHVKRVAVDKDGYVYAGGLFIGSVNFGTTTLSSYTTSSADAFLAKYDSLGNNIWAIAINGQSGEDNINDICFDHFGDVYISGYVNGAASFGVFTPTAYGYYDAFVAKVSSAGSFAWASRIGTSTTGAWEEAMGISADIHGNVYATVKYYGTLWFSGGPYTTATGGMGYAVLNYNAATGAQRWAYAPKSSDNIPDVCTDEYGYAYTSVEHANNSFDFLKFDNIGNVVKKRTFQNVYGLYRMMWVNGKIYAYGGVAGAVSLDGHSLSGAGAMICTFDTSLTNLYLKPSYSGSSDALGEIAVDEDGILSVMYLKGSSVTLPNGIHIQGGWLTWFPIIIQYDANGDPFNAERIIYAGTAGHHAHYGLAIARKGHYYTGGYFTGSAQAGNNILLNTQTTDVDGLICRIRIPNVWQGDVLHTNLGISHGQPNSEDSTNVSAIDPWGNILLAGPAGTQLSGTIIKYDPNGNILWQKANIGGSVFEISAIETDPASGSVYVCASYSSLSSFTIDGVTVPSTGNFYQSVLIKLNGSTGTCIWVKTFGASSESDYARDLHVDKTADHFIHVAGVYRGVASFGSFSLPAPTSFYYGTYWTKIDTNGNFQFALNITGNTNQYRHVSVDGNSSGDIYFAGNRNLSITIGTQTIPGSGGVSGMWLAKFDNYGNFQWAKSTFSLEDAVHQMRLDPFGNPYIIGYYKTSCTFQTGLSLSAPSGIYNSYVVKYNSSGTALWAQNISSFTQDEFKGMAFNTAGDVFITGYFRMIMSTGNGANILYSNENAVALNNISGSQLMLLKYSSSGQFAWSQAFRNTKDMRGRNMEYNPANGYLYCSGIFNTNSTIQGNALNLSGSSLYYDWFLTRFKDLSTCSMSAQINNNAPSCNSSNGSLIAVAGGGNGPYTYQWNTGASTDTLGNIAAGTYSVKITDASGCVAYDTLTSGMTIQAIQTSAVSCYGQANGQASVIISGGTAPYSYYWSNGVTSAGNTSLTAGTHSVTVTSAGCSVTATVNITQPPQIQNVMYHTQDSIWVAYPQYGYAPYTYSWSTGSTASGIANTNYATGYTVTTTDQRGCTSAPAVTSIPAPAQWNWVKVANTANTTSYFSFQERRIGVPDKNGNYYMGCIFNGTVTVGPNTYVSTNNDFFVAKYDAGGNFLWSTQFGTTSNEQLGDMVTDTSGNLYITGFYGNVSFTLGTYTLTTNGNKNMFIAKLNPAGVVQWAQKSSGTGNEEGHKLCTDLSGNVYVSGTFTGNGMFGVYSYVAAAGTTSTFVVRYNSSGSCIWAKQGILTGGGSISAMAYDRVNASVLITGQFNTSATFGSYSLTSTNYDIMVVRYNQTNGTEQYAQRYGGYSSNNGDDIKVMSNGDFLLCYNFISDTIVVSPADSLIGNGVNNMAISRFNAAGSHIKTFRTYATTEISSDNRIIATSMALNADNQLYVTGIFEGKTRFANDGTYLISKNYNQVSNLSDVFLLNIDPFAMQLNWATSAGGVLEDIGYCIAIDTMDNALYCAGSIKSVNASFEPITASTSSTQRVDFFGGRLAPAPPFQSAISYANPPACHDGNNGSALVTAIGGQAPYTYLWTPGNYSGSVVNTLSPGNYTVTITDANSSVSTVTLNISNPAPLNVSAGTDVHLCPGASASLSASGANTYLWSPATGIACSTCINTTASPAITTQYILTGTTGACSQSDTLIVFRDSIPLQPGTISPNDTLCSNSAITFSVSPVFSAGSYIWTLPSGWSGTSASNSINVNTSATGGTISVAASNTCGTSAPQLLAITILPSPAVALNLNADTLCLSSAPVSLSGGSPAGGTYSGNGVNAGLFNPAIAGTGSSSVSYSVTDPVNGCVATATSIVFVDVCLDAASQISESAVNLWPNPNKGDFNIALPSNLNGASYIIINSTGQKADEGILGTGEQKIHLDKKNADGLYIVLIYNKANALICTKRIIISPQN